LISDVAINICGNSLQKLKHFDFVVITAAILYSVVMIRLTTMKVKKYLRIMGRNLED
jgi:hypothetical protein